MPIPRLTAEIRAAILMHRGGHQKATDEQLLRIWDSLEPSVQQQYLNAAKPAKDPKEQPTNDRARPDRNG